MSDKDTVYRQAAIDAINSHFGFNIEEEYGSAVQEVINGLPSAQQWIPCSERLPEDDVEVLITDDSGGVQWLGIDRMLSYEDGSGRFWIASQNPTAWMPLPEPWKGEQDG